MNPAACNHKPVLMPHHKGRKRLHLGKKKNAHKKCFCFIIKNKNKKKSYKILFFYFNFFFRITGKSDKSWSRYQAKDN